MQHPIKPKFGLILGLVLALGGVFCLTQTAQAAYGDTTTLLGRMYTGDGGSAMNAYLDMPQGFTVDGSGNIYVADTNNNVIRKIDTSQKVSTYAGNGEFGDADGQYNDATFGYPKGIVFNATDSCLYVADAGNNKIRKIDPSGNVTTLVTTDTTGFLNPSGIVVSGSDLYIADTGHGRVVKMSTAGGALTQMAAGLTSPLKLALGSKYLYAVDLGGENIVKISLSTYSTEILASDFTEPRSVTLGQVDYNDDGTAETYLYVSAGEQGVQNEIWIVNPDSGKKVLLITRGETEWLNMTSDMFIYNSRLYMLQGGGSSIFTFNKRGRDIQQIAGRHRYGDEEGNASTALIGRPQELALSPDGKILYIFYAQGNKLAKYNLWTDQLTHVAGHLMDSYTEGTGDAARFSDVISVAMFSDGKTMYLVDRNSNRVRKIDVTTGTTSYVTGAGLVNMTAESDNGYQEGGACADELDVGASGCAYFNRPTGLALTSDERTLYIADASNNRVRKIDLATKQSSLVAGSGVQGFTDGAGTNATFNGPFTLALSADDSTLYVADKYNHAVRAIDLSTNTVSTLVGKGVMGYLEGSFSDAYLAIPENIKMGPDGRLYVSEAGSLRVRKLDLSTQTTSLVSGSGSRGHLDGTLDTVEWDAPKGMTFLGTSLLVADFRNDLIRAIDLDSSVPSGRDVVAPGKSFMAYAENLRSGWNIAVGNVLGDEAKEVITGTGEGMGPHIMIFDEDGNALGNFFAYSDVLRTGVRLATGDLDGDGYDEILTVPGPGSPPHIRIFDGSGNIDVNAGFFALDGLFRGGAFIAAGDVDASADGFDEIVVAAGKGGGAQVTVHNSSGATIANFFAYDKNTFRNGITVATLDTDGDGKDEILTGPEYGSPHVQFFSIYPNEVRRLNAGFYAFDRDYKGGVTVAGGDYDGNGTEEMIIGSGIGMDTFVRIFNKRLLTPIKEIRPYAAGVTGGVIVAAGDIDQDGKDEILTMPRTNGGPNYRVLEE